MICNPITRQQVEIIGRLPPQNHYYQFDRRIESEFPVEFARVRFLSFILGGYDVGHERDININELVADDGSLEIRKAYEAAPLIEAGKAVAHA